MMVLCLFSTSFSCLMSLCDAERFQSVDQRHVLPLSVLGVIFESRGDCSTSAEVVVLALFVCISLLETAWDNSE